MTAFCSARIDGPGGCLFVDGNGKITAGNGTYAEPRPNAFSIVQIEDCPFRTPTCEAACYVHGLEANAPDVHALYRHNSRMLRHVVLANPVRRVVWANLLGEWISEHAPAGFRWHVSGDLTSEAHAAWIAAVCDVSSDVRHWIYTRSYPFIGPLLDVGNLALNLSCDRDNLWLARRYAERHGLRLAYMVAGDEPVYGDGYLEPRQPVAPDLPPGSVLFPDYALRGRNLERPLESAWWQSLTPAQRKQVCPVDYFGQSEHLRCGPCRKCLR